MGGSPWLPGRGKQRFLCGAIGYPIANIIMIFTGAGGWTGDVFASSLALKKKRISFNNFIRIIFFSYIGCLAGTLSISYIANAADLPCLQPCINIAKHKGSWSIIQILSRAIVGSPLMCAAIYSAKSSKSFIGKMLCIWLFVSMQVITDFEHCLGSMFALPCAHMHGYPLQLKKLIYFMLTSTFGNLIGIIWVVWGSFLGTIGI